MPEADALFALQDALWRQLSDLLSARMGLHYPRERWKDLERGVAAAAGVFGQPSAQACARWLLSAPLARDQIEVLAGCLTVGETYFFRDRRSFEVLEQEVLPSLLRSREAGERRLRIWSAGCATGEEPYSIAMLLARIVPDLGDWNVSILATDIDAQFLRKAVRGVYSEWSFRDAPAGIKERFFRKTKEGRFEIAPRIKSLVSFGYLNLAEDNYPSVESGTNAMDVVFCRNVLMYFEPGRARQALEKLAHSLLEGGWLFVSPVELPQVGLPELARVDFDGVIAHRKGVGAASREPPPPIEPLCVPCDVQPAVEEKHEAPVASPREEAAALYEQGRYVEAAQTLAAPSQDTNDAAAMALAARAYANQGRLVEALAWCDKALAAEKLNAGWCYLRATILGELGRPEDAAIALRRALYLDPDHALAHFALGNLLGRRGRRKDAERHFRNALAALSALPQAQVLPESEGITVGRLAELIRAICVSSEVAA